MKDHTQ